MKIGFIGVGKLGMPCAEEIVHKGHTVDGYDVAEVQSDYVNVVSSIEEAVSNKEIVFIAVPTPHDPLYDGNAPTAHLPTKDFSYDIVKEVLFEANKHMTEDQLLVLISTVLPGTTRQQFVQLVTNTRFVYNPYLIAMGSVAWDMVNPEMVMIGTEDGSETGDAKQLVEFYKTVMENDPRYVIGTWDECECIKVFYNTFISTKISLVNMIQDVAQKQGNINVDVVTKALSNCEKRIVSPMYLKAGMGDGGACHPRDNIALRYMADKLELGYDLFDTIMNAREVQAKNLAKELCKIANEYELPILINGVAYKPGVHYVDGSYALLVDYYCNELGFNPMKVDPKVYGEDKGPFRALVLLAHPKIYVDLTEDSIVLDPWREHTSNKYTVIHYGNTRI